MKKEDYWKLYSQRHLKFNKVDMIFESIMSDTPIMSNIKSDPTFFIVHKDLNVLLEEIEKPHYIVSESTGDAILLEEALFWSKEQLITEGILDKVFSKVKEIYEDIKTGIFKVLEYSTDAIKSFCERIKNSTIVKAIIKKLKLDSLMGESFFRGLVKTEKVAGKKIAGKIEFNIKGLQDSVRKIGREAIGKPAVTTVAKAEGGDAAVEELKKIKSSETSEQTLSESIIYEGEYWDKIKTKAAEFGKKASETADKVGNAMKKGVQKIAKAAKEWYAKQNKFVKLLIWLIIIVLVIAGICWCFTAVILPFCAVAIQGGIFTTGLAVFQLYAAGQSFKATYKAGQEAWESESGWGKFFLYLGSSILTCVGIKSIAAKGQAMMQAATSNTAKTAAVNAMNKAGIQKASTSLVVGTVKKTKET